MNSMIREALPVKVTPRCWLVGIGLIILFAIIPWSPVWAARHALVVGNDSYRHVGRLQNARTDAKAVASALKSAGFEVKLALDQDRNQLNETLRNFRMTLVSGDEAVFYFAGHGVQISGANYLLPVDIRGDSEEQVKDDALLLQRVLDEFSEQRVSFTLILIDACRDNPFKLSGKHRNMATRGLVPTSVANGQIVVFSAGTGQKALDRLNNEDLSPNGLFTRVLLSEIVKPGISVDRVIKNVRKDVVRLAQSVGHDQVPAIYDQSIGEFFLVRESVSSKGPELSYSGNSAEKPQRKKLGQSFSDCDQCPEMVLLPSGAARIGSNDGDADERPVRELKVASFSIGKFEVTRGQFDAFVREAKYNAGDTCWTFEEGKSLDRHRSWLNPGFAQNSNHPVVCVNWKDAQAYVKWLRDKTGKPYRLPSEVEWEYVARAGSISSRYWGDDADQACSNANVMDAHAKKSLSGVTWQSHDCNDGVTATSSAGYFKPNAFGIYDMIGNAAEWVEDCWNPNYEDAPLSQTAWARGDCSRRVIRGGSWLDRPHHSRIANRDKLLLNSRMDTTGFRVVLSENGTKAD